MERINVNVNIRNIQGSYAPFSLFQFFNDGIRRRVPKLIAQEFEKQIKQNIDSNAFGFILSRRWVQYKQRIGADSRPYVMFGHYKNSITTVIDSQGHIAVGFKKTAMHPRAKIAVGRLAIQLEYGSLDRGIPARPIWRKTAQNFFKHKSAIKDMIANEIMRGVRR